MVYKIIFLLAIFVFTTGFIGNCGGQNEGKQAMEVGQDNTALNSADDLDTGNNNINEDKEQSANQAPMVQGINISQLHANYDDTPHRYQLAVIARDPEGNVISYDWSVDCGYLIQEKPINPYTNRKEWRYDTPGECVEATITVKVYDTAGNMTLYSLTPF